MRDVAAWIRKARAEANERARVAAEAVDRFAPAAALGAAIGAALEEACAKERRAILTRRALERLAEANERRERIARRKAEAERERAEMEVPEWMLRPWTLEEVKRFARRFSSRAGWYLPPTGLTYREFWEAKRSEALHAMTAAKEAERAAAPPSAPAARQPIPPHSPRDYFTHEEASK